MVVAPTALTLALALAAGTALAPAPSAVHTAGSVHGAAPRQAAETVKEGESGHRYPATVRSVLRDVDKDKKEAKPKELQLLGLAIREKYFIKVNVYSYVLYVDEDFAKKELSAWKTAKRSALEKDKKLFAKLLGEGGTKELRLRFCRNVDADDVVSAFEDSIEPRILERRKAEKRSKAKKLEDVKTFREMFTLDKLKDGNELRFTWHPDGTLSTIIDGKRQPDLKSPDLCWALFDVYLGDDPISTSGKKKLVRRVPTVLQKMD